MINRNLATVTSLVILIALSSVPIAANGSPQDRTDAVEATQPNPVSAADFGTAETWGGAGNVVSVKHLYFSEQPDAATLIEARDRGVGVVINLREPSEFDWDEANAATDAGLSYYNVPISATGSSFDAATMEEVSALVRKHSDQKIFLHCSSGNRAGAWLAVHLVNDHGMRINPSISLAQKAGLTKPGMETRVRNYLNDGEQSPTKAE